MTNIILMSFVSSGFINIHLKKAFVSKLLSNLLINGVQPPPLASRKKVCHMRSSEPDADIFKSFTS